VSQQDINSVSYRRLSYAAVKKVIVMNVRIAPLVFAIVLAGCAPDKRELLQGSWKIDSVHSYYNGFGYTRTDTEEEPLQHYQPDGRLRMTREAEFRFFIYEMPTSDSLVHRSLDKKMLSKYQIVQLDPERMVLKKELQPVFPGKGQVRYELRYFSRIKE